MTETLGASVQISDSPAPELSVSEPPIPESLVVESLVADAPFVGSLSPSRAADFKTCPLLYRFRSIDHLPEAPSRAATRGTVVHAVLERLFDLPASGRTLDAAQAMIEPAWLDLLEQHPELASLFATAPGAAHAEAGAEVSTEVGAATTDELREWLGSAATLLENYFALEDPTRLEPDAREQLVEVVSDGLRLRGYVDRIDASPAGDLRVVDYKTGAVPREAFEGKALFQMKFYALVLWRTRGIVPKQLRLMYLADRDTLSYAPEAAELERFERTLHAIWAAIARATEAQDFRPNPSRLCDWCDHHAHCPAFGGTPPPFPVTASATAEIGPASPISGALVGESL